MRLWLEEHPFEPPPRRRSNKPVEANRRALMVEHVDASRADRLRVDRQLGAGGVEKRRVVAPVRLRAHCELRELTPFVETSGPAAE